MSTLAYAALTSRREEAEPDTSHSKSPPGVRSYVDTLAALVPAEVLTLHAVILSFTTVTRKGKASEGGHSITEITEPDTLYWAFFGLLLFSVALYVAPRLQRWDRLDYIRVAIPPIAFVAWTMLQRATAFDAISPPQLGAADRTLIALFVAVFLGVVTSALANRADKKPRPAQ